MPQGDVKSPRGVCLPSWLPSVEPSLICNFHNCGLDVKV